MGSATGPSFPVKRKKQAVASRWPILTPLYPAISQIAVDGPCLPSTSQDFRDKMITFPWQPLGSRHKLSTLTMGQVTMYAIIKEDGRQLKVEEGQEISVDFRDIPKGGELKFDKVLAVSGDEGVTIGRPTIDGASVTVEVLGTQLGDKLVVQKFRRRKNSRRKTGHRQMFTRVLVNKIQAS
jgi:large subunit ribosomal protein L21